MQILCFFSCYCLHQFLWMIGYYYIVNYYNIIIQQDWLAFSSWVLILKWKRLVMMNSVITPPWMPNGVHCQQALWCHHLAELAHRELYSLSTAETVVNLEHQRTKKSAKKRSRQWGLLFDVLFYFVVTGIIGRLTTRHSIKQFDCLKLFLTRAAHVIDEPVRPKCDYHSFPKAPTHIA